jgi:hypothetical protein
MEDVGWQRDADEDLLTFIIVDCPMGGNNEDCRRAFAALQRFSLSGDDS